MKLESIKESSFPSGDRKASEELRSFYRHEELKDQLHIIFKIGLYLVFIAFISVFIVRVVHLIVPTNYYWLSEDQIQSIDKVFFSGAIGGIIGGYMKDKLQKY